MRKRITSILLAVTMTISSFSSIAGQWINIGNWYYLDDNGNYLKNQWVGNYYLGSDGVMMTNSWTPDGYYVGADGAWTGQSANNNNSQNSQNVSETKDPVGTYIRDDGVTMIYDEDGPLIGYVEISKNNYGSYDIDIVQSYKGPPYGTVNFIYANIPFYITHQYKNNISTYTLLFDGYDTITVADEDQNTTVYHRINDNIKNHINYNSQY